MKRGKEGNRAHTGADNVKSTHSNRSGGGRANRGGFGKGKGIKVHQEKRPSICLRPENLGKRSLGIPEGLKLYMDGKEERPIFFS